jgi:hypothetical protein
MNNRIVCDLITVFLFFAFVPPATAQQEDMAGQVLVKINLVRTEPPTFA